MVNSGIKEVGNISIAIMKITNEMQLYRLTF